MDRAGVRDEERGQCESVYPSREEKEMICTLTPSFQRPLVSNTILEDGKRFSIVFQLSGSPLFIRDHQDVP